MKTTFITATSTSLIALMFLVGCKRESGSRDGSTSVTGSSAESDQVSASGSGGVYVSGNQLVFQNVHVQLPWNPDPAAVIKVGQEAASGMGLKLSDGKQYLEISSDGHSLGFNGRDYGALKPNDRVVLTSDGKLTVNGQDRQPQSATTLPTKESVTLPTSLPH